MSDCAQSLEDFKGYGFAGDCCCNCIHQVTLHRHPWNRTEAVKGTGEFSKGCIAFIADGHVAIHEHGDHGMCELHERKSV